MYKYIIIIISLIFPFSIQAANCTLKNVLFEGLNDRQIEVLKLSGARCTSTNVSGPKFGDPGFILIDGKRMDFLDVASEDALRFSHENLKYKQIMYFYSYWFKEDSRAWGYEFSSRAFEGKKSYNGGQNATDPMIMVIISPSKNKISEYEKKGEVILVLKAMRKKYFKILTKYDTGMGLLKAEGKFLRYSNQNQLYFLTETIELVSTLP